MIPDAAPSARITQPRVAIPFLIITLIWSSTWLVIRDQLGVVPANWSIAYRFLVAAIALGIYGLVTGSSFQLDRTGQLMAAGVGLTLFTLNFTFVYAAEAHVTSGLVAVVFAMLLVPNALLGWLVLGQRISRMFIIGSAIAIGGLVLLFRHELLESPSGTVKVALGIGFTLLGVTCASIANVMQATGAARRQPMIAMITIAMAWGTLFNVILAWIVSGPPVIDPRLGYLAGVAYLGIAASSLCFPLYFGVIRAIGPARAAYSSVLVPVIAMGLSTVFEGYRWSVEAGAGGVLTMVGLIVALNARKPAQ